MESVAPLVSSSAETTNAWEVTPEVERTAVQRHYEEKKESTNERQIYILNLDRTAVSISDVLLCLGKKEKAQEFFMKNSHACMSQSHKQDNIKRLQTLRLLVNTDH